MRFVIPWFIRLEIDIWLGLAPILLMCNYPFTVFTPFMEKHRLRRKRKFDTFSLVDTPIHKVEEVQKIYADLGFQEHL